MSNTWRKANREKTQEFRTEDGDNYIVLRDSLTKSEANHLTEFAPSADDPSKNAKAAGMLEEAFKVLVIDWSLEEDNGEKILPTIDAYREMEAAPARWVDEQVMKQMSKLMGIEVQETEGKLSE